MTSLHCDVIDAVNQFRLFRLPTKQLSFQNSFVMSDNESNSDSAAAENTPKGVGKQSEEVLNSILEKLNNLSCSVERLATDTDARFKEIDPTLRQCSDVIDASVARRDVLV